MKKISFILTCLFVAGLAQADVVTTYMKPNSTTLTSGALDASTASATFEWSANNATIQMTLLADGGNIFSDDSATGVDNFRIGSTQGVTISFNVTADAGYQLDALSFERVRYAATDEGSTYTFTDNLSNIDNFTATAAKEQYFGFVGGANVQVAFVNVAPLTKDNQDTWTLHGTTDAGAYAINDFKITTDVSVIPEPAALGLIGLSGLGLLAARRFFLI
ncbi:PEP-CTERM sorting domain-containing protein [Pontiella sulfatireligans]|uniref:Ice-binding protein C-terminal domain-containing protein n=1 Tax=Pontiella sulfatireligans TaxID=2750658 RepID=A0A6C2UED3_9BACT|nr:PEP-CTERM sorting domain-containing protein [Pontiella sulfatireligans]VGO18515.1 hypothetical protein SCARR_00568 [Pontiella sulfatireligans]